MSASARHRQQILTINCSTEPPTLDPGRSTDVTSIAVLHMLFEGLTRPSFHNPTEPAIAKTIEISEDGKTYTFYLRKTRWANGDPLTAHDFVFAWKRHLSPTFPCEAALLMYGIKGAKAVKEGTLPLDDLGVKAIDDYVLVVELEHPNPAFLSYLEMPLFFPLHRATVEANPKWSFEPGSSFISNGPFLLSSWSHHNNLVVIRNPNYWDAPSVHLSAIAVEMVEDGNTELALFDGEALDWAGMPIGKPMPVESLASLSTQYQLAFAPVAGTQFYVLNTTTAPFNNLKMRQAFAYAIKREDIIANIAKGGEQVTTCILPPGLSLQKQPTFEDGNLIAARKLFEEALQEMGITKRQLPAIRLTYSGSDLHHKLAQVVQSQWKEAFGIDIELDSQDWKVFLDQLTHKNFTIGSIAFMAPSDDAHLYLKMLVHPDNPLNVSGWSHDGFLKLMEEAEETAAPDKRADLTAQAERIALKQMPMIPVYSLSGAYLSHPKLKDYYFSPTGFLDFRYAYFEDEEL